MGFSTVTATVLRQGEPAFDRLGMPVSDTFVLEEVPGVLVAPGTPADMDAARPQGVTVALTLHFPKSYAASLRGCSVELPAPWDRDGGYRVIGDPQPYMGSNTPGRWNRAVMVEVADG